MSSSRDELRGRLADPAVREAILAEPDLPPDPPMLFDGDVRAGPAQHRPHLRHRDSRPTTSRRRIRPWRRSPRARGEDPLADMYDLMLECDAGAMLMLPFFNYAEGNHDAIYEMMSHPAAVSGLSDGGAHCGMICDASYPTYLLTHWARDRHRGPKFSLEYVVRKQTLDTATLFGLSDRGVISVGKKADLNVIDMDALNLELPRMVYDLPAGGRG